MTTTDLPPDPRRRRRNRFMLLAIVALFVLPIVAARLLNMAGQRPDATRQHGDLLQPPIDLSTRVPQLADGGDYAWDPQARTWRLLVVPPPSGCTQACVRIADKIDTVWNLLGRHAEHVDVLWMGRVPDAAQLPSTLRVLRDDPGLRAQLPRRQDGHAGVPLYVIDPNGFVILRYPPDFAAGGLRADLARLLKLQ